MPKPALIMQIIKQLTEIALRKREPQDLDYSLEAAIVLTMSMVFLRYTAFSSTNAFSNPFAYSLVSIIGQSGLIYALLRSQDKASRFIQTLTALYGINIIANAVLVLMVLTVVLQLALPVLLIWTIYLTVIILRSALECSTVTSLLFTILYSAFGYLLVFFLFPQFEAEMLAEWEKMMAAVEAAQLEAQSK